MRSSAISLRGLAQSLIFTLVLAGFVTMPTFSLKALANDPLVINNGFCNLPGGNAATNYSITSAWELWESVDCDGASKVFTLTQTIVLTGVSDTPTNSPIGGGSQAFTGTLNGGGHAISGISMVATGNKLGLFFALRNATVSNLSLRGEILSIYENLGALAAGTSGNVEISSVSVAVDLRGGNRVGGFFGSSGNVEDPGTTVIRDSSFTGQISATRDRVGGFVGNAEEGLEIRDSWNFGAVKSEDDNYVGGLVGYAQGPTEIVDSKNSGVIEGRNYVGGAVGEATHQLTIQNFENLATGTVTGVDSNPNEIGGIVGSNALATITNSTNRANVSGAYRVGGLVGLSSRLTSINSSFNYGVVSSTTGNFFGWSQAGGLIGRAEQEVEVNHSWNFGAVSGRARVGGLIGDSLGHTTISNTLNKGSVTATTGYAGGLVGVSDAIVELLRSWNSAPVSGANYVGGLVGFFFNYPGRYLIAVDSVNTGAVTANDNGGGFVGLSNEPHQIVRSYQAGILSSGIPSDALFLGVPSTITSVYTNQSPSQWIPISTDAELRLASTYVGWDFDTVWGFIDCTTNNGFPVLRFAYPGETFRTDGCEAVVGTTATQSATTSSDVATTSSEIVETERGPILFKGPLILAFDKRDIASDTPTQIRVIGVRLNFITGLMVDGKEVEFTKIGTKGMVIELPALSSGVHHLMIETTRYGKLTLFRAFAVK